MREIADAAREVAVQAATLRRAREQVDRSWQGRLARECAARIAALASELDAAAAALEGLDRDLAAGWERVCASGPGGR